MNWGTDTQLIKMRKNIPNFRVAFIILIFPFSLILFCENQSVYPERLGSEGFLFNLFTIYNVSIISIIFIWPWCNFGRVRKLLYVARSLWLYLSSVGRLPILDTCLKPGKIEALKMLDLQTKSAIKSLWRRVMLQATNLAFESSVFPSAHPISKYHNMA